MIELFPHGHAIFENDTDHMCDYGCGTVMTECSDAEKDGDHVCDVCGKGDVTKHTNFYTSQIDLKKIGFCGGSIEATYCDDCNEPTSYSIVKILCQWDANTHAYKENTDKTGLVYYTEKKSCLACDLVMELNGYRRSEGDCMISVHEVLKISDGKNVQFELTVDRMDDNHNYQDKKYELSGKTCSDGYIIYQTCSLCGHETTAKGKDHKISFVTLELKSYGACSGSVAGEMCCVCQQFVRVDSAWMQCQFKHTITRTEIDGVQHTLVTETCSQCGLERKSDSWNTRESVCVTTEYRRIQLTFGNSLFINWTETESNEGHNYRYSYEKLGVLCDEGINIVEYCINCDVSNTVLHWGHFYEFRRIRFEEFGMCLGFIEEERCIACENVFYQIESSCAWEYQGVNDFGQHYEACSLCGALHFWWSGTSEKDSFCYIDDFHANLYMINDMEVYRQENHNGRFEHSLVIGYEMLGATCDDGYRMYEHCKDCAYWNEQYEEGQGHLIEWCQFDLAEFSVCGGVIEGNQCLVCGRWTEYPNIQTFCEWEEIESSLSEQITYVCRVCGARYLVSTMKYKVEETCEVEIQTLHIFQSGEMEFIFDYDESYTVESHKWSYTYKLNGKTCDEGYYELATCQTCGMSQSNLLYGHAVEAGKIYLDKYGMCGGIIVVETCRICQKTSYIPNTSCDWKKDGSSEKDKTTYTCQNCNATHMIWSEKTKVEGVCAAKVTTVYSYQQNGKEVFRYEDVYYAESHKWEYTYKLNGKTCEEGYYEIATCRDCGLNQSDLLYGHAVETRSIYFDKYGMCSGRIREDVCVICQNVTRSVNMGCDWQETDSSNNEKTVYNCRGCGATYLIWSEKTKVEGACAIKLSKVHCYQQNGKEVFRYEEYEYIESHNLQVSYKLLGKTCEEGLFVVEYCTDCKLKNSWEQYNHVDKKRNLWAKDLGMCYADLIEYTCSVCHATSHWAETTCEWEKTSASNKEKDVYACTKCGATYLIWNEKTKVEGSCTVKIAKVYSYYMNGQEIFRMEDAYYQEAHNIELTCKMNGKTCNEGLTVIEYCTNCSLENSWNHSGHFYETNVIRAEKYGMCQGDFVEEICIACHQTFYNSITSCAWEEIANEKEKTVYRCSVCSATYSIWDERSWLGDGCAVKVTTVYCYQQRDNEVFRYEKFYITESHKWESVYIPNGENCEDGVTVIETCMGCGETKTFTSFGHYYETNEIRLETYGMCSGVLLEEFCKICGKVFVYPTTSCEWEPVDQGGDVMLSCRNCHATQTILNEKIELDGVCEIEYKMIHIYQKDGQDIVYYEEVFYEPSHTWLRTYQNMGETCADGLHILETCEVCGCENKWDLYGHDVTSEMIYLDEYGMCFGKLFGQYCMACGGWTYAEIQSECQWHEIKSEKDDQTTWECDGCHAIWVTSPYVNGFGRVEGTLYVYLLNGNEVFRFVRL